MHVIDFVIFILFTLGVVVFGCSFFKKGSSADEFTSAGHSIPGWVVGMSIFATYVSSISYIGYPGKAFASDWNAFVFSLSIPIASYFAAKYFVPFYRHSGSVSAYTFLEEKFGAWARLYASACYLLTQIARMGSILYLLAVPMYILMGWDMHTVIICTTVGIIVYSMMGGLKAVIWADAIQGIILIGGAVLCLIILMCSMPEGPMQTFELAAHSPMGNKFSLGAFTDDLTTLEPSDNAATANWGNGWRMPTQAEFQELLGNTTNTWTTQNGVNGWLFTANNGKTLFLPAAGYRYDGNLGGSGSGYYRHNCGYYGTSDGEENRCVCLGYGQGDSVNK